MQVIDRQDQGNPSEGKKKGVTKLHDLYASPELCLTPVYEENRLERQESNSKGLEL